MLLMNCIEELFCCLIRVAIGTQEPPSTELRAGLSRLPSHSTGSGLIPAEWEELFEMAVKQSLVGLCFVGVKRCLERVCLDDDLSLEEALTNMNIPSDLYYNWMGMAFQIEQRNAIVNAHCIELQESLAKIGVRSSILKGQGVAALYRSLSPGLSPEGERSELSKLRQSGDIDIYVNCGREKAIELARKIQDKVDWDIKHLHLKIFPDTAVEMHYRVEVLLNLRKNRKLQKWFREPEVSSSMFHVSGDLICPSVEFNLFYILLHSYRHFLYEGVGMRQLMDYYFVLQANGSKGRDGKESKERALSVIKQFGMTRFVKGVMWIMNEVFGMPEQLLLVEPNEKEGRYILSEVMTGGNFGHHDERLSNSSKGKLSAIRKILRHNLHLLTHYPGDTLWSPIWIVYHWCWKRLHRI